MLNIFYQDDLENALREIIRDAERSPQQDLIRYIAFTLLGKINFEKGLMPIAYNHFKEALKHLRNTRYEDKEEEARLKAWLGLISLKIGEFKEAVNLLREAIGMVELLFGRGELLGELKVLLADALYFVDSNEAVQVAEDAHEILKQFATPLYLSNALKLTAALAARRFNNEAASILREAFDKYSRLLFTFNASFVRTLKAIENNSKRMIFYIDPTLEEALIDLIIGLEGLKGAYYLYRKATRLEVSSSKLLNINKSIVKALLKGKSPDDLFNSKRRHLEMMEDKVVLGAKPRPIYSINSILENLLDTFNHVAILSFIEGDESHIYRISLLELPDRIVKTKIIEIGDEILEAQDLPPKLASVKIEKAIPRDFLSALSRLKDKDLLIVSVDGKLSSVPWDLIPANEYGELKYLGLITNVVYVPTLHEMSFWDRKREPRFERSFYIASKKLNKKQLNELELVISECGFSPIKNIGNIIGKSFDLKVDLMVLCDEGIESPDDDIYFKLDRNYISMMDLEKVAFKGDLAIVCTNGSLQSTKDEVGIHNPTLSFLMSGYKAALGYIGSTIDTAFFFDFLIDFFREESEPVYKKIFKTKHKANNKNRDWWRFQLYGNPLVKIL